MLAYARKAMQFAKGRSRSDLDHDEILALAIIHSVEIIGEAVTAISEEVRSRYPEVPWEEISGTRNRLIHGYIDIDLDIIWSIVTRDLPSLVKKLERILKKESRDSGA